MTATYWPFWIIGGVMAAAVVSLLGLILICASPISDCDDPDCDICAKEDTTTDY